MLRAWEDSGRWVGTNLAVRVDRDRRNAREFIKRMEKARETGGFEAGDAGLRNENRNGNVLDRILPDSLAKLAVDSPLRLSPN